MKKNKFMKLASGLLVLCLMTTCVIGATLAKYTTGSSASDTARVAKWGVTVSASGTLFGKDYAATTADTNKDSIIAATSTNVSAANNVVAPGTKNDTGLQLKVAGQPEVAFAVTATASGTDIYLKAGTYGVMVQATGVTAATDVTKLYTTADHGATYQKGNTYDAGKTYYQLVDTVVLADDYHPIVWKLNNGSSTETKTMAELVDAVKDLAVNYNANVPVNVSYTITWAWAIENGATKEEKANNNKADSILGNIGHAVVVKASGEGENVNYVAVVKTTDYNLNVAFNASITATQID